MAMVVGVDSMVEMTAWAKRLRGRRAGICPGLTGSLYL